MAFGLDFLFNPLKALAGTGGTSLFGGPAQAAIGAAGGSAAPASILAPQNNGGLLHSGAEDIVGMGGNPARQVNMMRADEGPGDPRGLKIDEAPPTGPSLGGGRMVPERSTPLSTAPAPLIAGGPIIGGNSGNPIPASQRPTAPTPGESSAPLMAPYQATPQTAPAPTPAAGGGSTTPGASPTTRLPGQSGMDKLGEMGKALQGAGGAAAGKAAGFAPGGVGAPHSPDGAALMAKVMEASAPFQGAGPVPGMPPGLLQRFRR